MLPAWSQSVLYHQKFTYGCELHDELSFCKHRIRESDGHVADYNARHRGDGSPANGYAMSARSISRAFVALRNDASRCVHVTMVDYGETTTGMTDPDR